MTDKREQHGRGDAACTNVMRVFGIDLLREMVIDRAIRNKDDTINWRAVNSIRLVNKTWLQSTSKSLTKHHQPLHRLRLTADNSLNSTVGNARKLLDQFFDEIKNSSLSTGPAIPSFGVTIREDVFVKENRESLCKMLVQYGTRLVNLDIYQLEWNGEFCFMFPPFTLSNLRALSIHMIYFEGNDNVAHMINNLINAAASLKSLIVQIYDNRATEDDIMNFEYFTLPDSIQTLSFDCFMTTGNLDVFFKNSLPNLSSLSLEIPNEEAYPLGTLFKILSNFKGTLKKLTFQQCLYTERKSCTSFRFPPMERLQVFINNSVNCALEPGADPLQDMIPKLSWLALPNHTKEMFMNWTTKSSISSVKELTLYIVNALLELDDINHMVGVGFEEMRMTSLTFKNIQRLDVNVDIKKPGGIKCIFKEMVQLKDLSFRAVDTPMESIEWEVVLIGVTKKTISTLRGYEECIIKLVERVPKKRPSITNLKGLTRLTLSGNTKSDSSLPLISDLTFTFAFLLMSKLRELILGTRFKASPKMASQWAAQGRTLVRYNF